MARYEWNSKYILKTPNTSLAVTLIEMKAYLKIDTDDENALITSLIKAATLLAEQYTSIEFLKKTFTMYMDLFPFYRRYGNRVEENLNQGTIQVKRGPLVSITNIKYYTDEVLTTLDNTLYDFTEDDQYSRIYLIDDSSAWPATDRKKQSVQLEFIAGLSTDGTDLPEDVKTAIKRIVAYLFENRGDCEGCKVCILSGAAPFLNFYRILEI